ncbi:MAG: hypothetical protein AAF704_08050 [Cyanobacteria bacterium P01_D01_bin.123]
MQLALTELTVAPVPTGVECWQQAIEHACQQTYPNTELLRWAITRVEADAAQIEAAITWGDRAGALSRE